MCLCRVSWCILTADYDDSSSDDNLETDTAAYIPDDKSGKVWVENVELCLRYHPADRAKGGDIETEEYCAKVKYYTPYYLEQAEN